MTTAYGFRACFPAHDQLDLCAFAFDALKRAIAAQLNALTYELIAPWCLAVRQKLNIRAFAALVLPYPTLAETGKRAAIAYFMPGLRNIWVQRLIALVRRFR